jgi:hypothetical protein
MASEGTNGTIFAWRLVGTVLASLVGESGVACLGRIDNAWVPGSELPSKEKHMPWGKPLRRLHTTLLATVLIGATSAFAEAQQTTGEIKGSAWQHTPASLADAVGNGVLVLPAAATGRGVYQGKFKDAPAITGRFPVVIFLHGSSGLGLKAIGEWQLWLASLRVASIAPDSFTLPDRITYTSPVDKATYEKIHALRASEIATTLAALLKQPWVDPSRIVLAGTSEGSVAVARYAGSEFAGRIVYS